MARSKKKLKGISYNYDGRTPDQVGSNGELALRESFLRASRELLDNFGIDKYSVERLQGMVGLLETFAQVTEELES